MLNPGIYSLGDQLVTTAVTGLVLTPVVDLDGLTAVTLQVRFAPVSGGTTCKAWVQTSLDQGQTDAAHHRAGADRCDAGRRHGGGRRVGRPAAPEDHLDRHLRVGFGDLRQGSVPMTRSASPH